MQSSYLDAIRKLEGFIPQAQWDYAQFTNGYGTRARFPGEVVDRAEAERRFQTEIANARAVVERHAPNLDEGTKAALTSLTFNAGCSWVSSGLGEAVQRGDLDDVRAIFNQYCKAGGEVVAGLVSRRAAEALWIGDANGGGAGSTAPGGAVATSRISAPPEVAAAGAPADGAGGAVSAAPSQGEHGQELDLRASLDDTRVPREVASAAVTSLISSNLSEIARLVRLDNGHHFLASDSERKTERARG
jgi:lysozyme